jgi:putative ABC transport system permease protein
MNLAENIREGLRAIQANLLRTVLTALIVTIGIMALVGMLTAVDGIKNGLDSTLSSLGAASFDIEAKNYYGRGHGGRQGKTYPPITYQQAMQYQKLVSEDARVSLSASVRGAVVVKHEAVKTNPNTEVLGIDEQYLQANNYVIDKGRPFSNSELEFGAQVTILGSEVAKKLFGKGNPLNKQVSFLGKHYRVVGVLEPKGSTMGSSGTDRAVMVPLETANQLPREDALTYTVKTIVDNPENLTYAVGEATGKMRQVRHDPLGQEDSFEIQRSDAVAKALEETSGSLQMVGILIGTITLMGACIGLMNIMMVSVTERTREIGVRKALGATILQIRRQFLVEAIVICMLGGIGGIILGILFGNGVSSLIGAGGFIIPWFWITVGLITCIVVGIVSGYYPAYKASKLDPIESLRYE